ncbi:MAG: hypothetical protein ABW321_24740 [Polyangiales bacterium]
MTDRIELFSRSYVSLHRTVRVLALIAFAACSSDDSEPPSSTTPDAATPDAAKPSTPSDAEAVIGTFTLNLEAPTPAIANGQTTVTGSVYDGPQISQVVLEEAAAAGSCKLYTPRVPFCETRCASGQACVEDDVCKAYPTRQSAGLVVVTGVRTSTGDSGFSMEPVANNYQVPTGLALPYPAFDEGADITLQATGATVPAFKLTAKGIKPLELSAETYPLTRGQPLALRWNSVASATASQIEVELDISHHGGSKGEIRCESDDTGTLDIDASLISTLLDKGIAGYPTVIVTRHAVGSARVPGGTIELVVASQLQLPVEIAGLTSCTTDEDCPSGQACQADLSCK